MKQSILILLSLILVHQTGFGQTAPRVQVEINKAYDHFLKEKEMVRLSSILDSLKQKHKLDEEDVANTYWLTYAMYKKAICLEASGNKKKAAQLNEQALDLLEDQAKHGTEILALWATIANYDLSFTSFLSLPLKARQVISLADKSLDLNENNPRAYLVKGVNNYYTPKSFGGGKRVEEFLGKVISLPERCESKDWSPTWGKNEAYWYLIKFYMDKGQSDKAKKMAGSAKEIFPSDFLIDSLYQVLNPAVNHGYPEEND